MAENEKYEEVNESLEFKFRKVGVWFTDHLSSIFAVLISLFFIFSGTVKVLPTELELKEQIIMAIINIFAGFSITSLVSEHGFKSAKEDKEYKREIREYNDAVKEGLKWREGVENLAKKKANDNLKNYRIHLLESVGLRYTDIFDTYDRLITEYDITIHKKDQNYHKKVRAYHKAINTKVFTTNVFGRASSSTYGLKRETSEKAFRTKNSIVKGITKLILGVVSVGIMFQWLGFTLGALIYSFMQVVLWTGMGLIDSQKNYNFILNEIKPQYETNRLIIQEFLLLPDKEKEKYMPSGLLMIEMKENVDKKVDKDYTNIVQSS